MPQNHGREDILAQLKENREALAQLARSSQIRQIMALLERQGGVQQAAQDAAKGDPSRLMEMLGGLMNSQEGAGLMARVEEEVKKAGLQ